MLRSCVVCKAGASPELQLQYCAACQSAMYCSKACQTEDWKTQHKKICKFLNVGHGDMQVRSDEHTSRDVAMKEVFERDKHNLDKDGKRFFKLFGESTFEGSRAAAQTMKKLAERQTTLDKLGLLYHSFRVLVRSSNSEKLSWPNSPLLVMLQFLDPNVLFGDEETRVTLLHMLAESAKPTEYFTHVNQLILARQLIDHGANVKAVSIPRSRTPLHDACSSFNVTNLDFIEYLLEAGADPNAQDHLGKTPLMTTIPDAAGAAKFLLKWPTTDANITSRSGKSFLARVRSLIIAYSNAEQVQQQFLLRQWREIEEMLVERGATDTGVAAFE
jgi:hypothetical protein